MAKVKPFSYAKPDRVKKLRAHVAERQKQKSVTARRQTQERALARQIMAAAGNALMHVGSNGASTAGRVKRRRRTKKTKRRLGKSQAQIDAIRANMPKILGKGRRRHKRPTVRRNKRGQFVKRR
jgi:hypothetical protein